MCDQMLKSWCEYLAPEWDFSGFDSKTLGQAKTEPLYRAGADVIYHAAGKSGQGRL